MALFTARGPEIDAMMQVLTDDQYADEKAMSKALLKAAFEQFLLREWWTVGVAPGESGKPVAFYGLGGSEGALRADITKTLEVGGRAMMIPVSSLADLAQRREALEEEWGKSELCGRCKHREWSHGAVTGKGGQPRGVPPCSVKCKCPGFVTEKAWKEEQKRAAEQAAREKELEEEILAQDLADEDTYEYAGAAPASPSPSTTTDPS